MKENRNIEKVLIDLSYDDSYLLAVSGGVDSMVLLYLFLNSGLSFSVVHCNFQLRGEDSELDEQLVRNFCEKNKLNFFSKKINTRKLKKGGESIEMAARSLRYAYFRELISQYGFDYLVTAHHLNDNAETFFINLLRGSGLKGLSGMSFNSNKILRPLLKFSRREIVEFAKEHKVVWREDLSNQSLDYLRNKIRHKIIPAFEEIAPDFLNQLNKSMKIMDNSYAFIEKKMLELKQKAIISQELGVCRYSKQILQKADFILVYYLFSSFGFSKEKDVNHILIAGTGKIFVSSTYKIWIDREELIVEELETKKEDDNMPVLIEKLPFYLEKPFILEVIKGENVKKRQGEERVDFNKLSFPLVLRKWKEGDFIYPVNGNGKKKVSKILKDNKISNFDKNKIRVLCDNSGAVIWVIGIRLDDRFKITPETQCCATLYYSPSKQ